MGAGYKVPGSRVRSGPRQPALATQPKAMPASLNVTRVGIDPVDDPFPVVEEELHVNDRLNPGTEHLRRPIFVRIGEYEEPAGVRRIVDNFNDAPSSFASDDPAKDTNSEFSHWRAAGLAPACSSSVERAIG